MSEPDAVFLKLKIARPDLIRWLDAPVPRASQWSDWRDIGGSYYFKGGPRDIKDISDEELLSKIAACDRTLSGMSSNRIALRQIIDGAEAPFLKRASYDAQSSEFVAGSLTYSENLLDFIEFLAIVRGAADFLGAEGSGVALIRNFIWGDPNSEPPRAAMRLGPGPTSSFMAEHERESAVGPFQEIADAMLQTADHMGEGASEMPPGIDELDTLR
jgi:hypothetical protein